MALFYPTPMAKYYWPYAVGGMSNLPRDWFPASILTNLVAVTYYLVGKAADASMNSSEFINDPRHPRFANGGKFIDLEKE